MAGGSGAPPPGQFRNYEDYEMYFNTPYWLIEGSILIDSLIHWIIWLILTDIYWVIN